jgi:succinate dehydrogenase/fumarate reductase cytochrome b subunit
MVMMISCGSCLVLSLLLHRSSGCSRSGYFLFVTVIQRLLKLSSLLASSDFYDNDPPISLVDFSCALS